MLMADIITCQISMRNKVIFIFGAGMGMSLGGHMYHRYPSRTCVLK